MKVRELADILSQLGDDRDVKLFWDGAPRGEVKAIYQQKDGTVVIAGEWSNYERSAARSYGLAEIFWEASDEE